MIREVWQQLSDWRTRAGARVVMGVAVGALGVIAGVALQVTRAGGRDDTDVLIASADATREPGRARAGHLLYQVLSSRLERFPNLEDPAHPQLGARISVRITDVQGTSDYIDNRTFHLWVDDEALTHENNINIAIGENSAVKTELIFMLPEDTTKADLVVGRVREAMVRIPLNLLPHRMAEG